MGVITFAIDLPAVAGNGAQLIFKIGIAGHGLRHH